MRAGFFVVVLPRKSQVYCGCGFLVNDSLTEGVGVGAPRLFSLPIGRHVGRAKVVSVQVVPLGLHGWRWVEGGEPRKAGARIVAGGRGCSNVFRMQGYHVVADVTCG